LSKSYTSDDPIRRFFVKVNLDPEFRKKFLENPVAILAREGVKLEPEVENEVMKLKDELNEKLPVISSIPSGYEGFLEDFAQGRELEKPKVEKPEIFIL